MLEGIGAIHAKYCSMEMDGSENDSNGVLQVGGRVKAECQSRQL